MRARVQVIFQLVLKLVSLRLLDCGIARVGFNLRQFENEPRGLETDTVLNKLNKNLLLTPSQAITKLPIRV